MRIKTAALLVIVLLLSCGESDEDEGSSVLLVIIDTIRADHLGSWGYERDVTPALDSLASAGTRFSECQAHSSWTLPSVSSILTGRTPREHGAGSVEGRMFGIPPSVPTLQSLLHSRGWSTCGLFNVVFLSEDFGFHRGFDHFDCRGVTGNRGTRRADETVDELIQWLDGLERGQPFLAVLHLYDPHIPYDPPPPWDTLYAGSITGSIRQGGSQIDTMQAVNSGNAELSPEGLRSMIDLYDGEIAFTDSQLQRLFRHLRSSGRGETTVIVVVGDHGEEFMEHSGIEHGRTLYQEVLHVPLIMSGPGIPRGTVVDRVCAQVDLLPTILEILGMQPQPGLPGIDLLSGVPEGRDLPSSNLLWTNVPQAAIRRDGLKLIWFPQDTVHQFYELDSDPLEQMDLESADSSMTRAAEYYWSTPVLADPPEVSFDEAENNQLRDLGYIR
ncbi:MAG: hypothetical protein AVO35_03975 [Candidatus Aegiribacteria sp. MLS_C]|nr:MAG: hypothetical protein AVO35_03975 [Candidatus Aegiribacteria sp. MLS_C]